mmetsp:Transcript_42548/g.112012  ORF Transcript_42548/g.112012 Transcript_42548/m.112012 type:complete len:340 (+) Transcript_42548:321-1340(+)
MNVCRSCSGCSSVHVASSMRGRDGVKASALDAGATIVGVSAIAGSNCTCPRPPRLVATGLGGLGTAPAPESPVCSWVADGRVDLEPLRESSTPRSETRWRAMRGRALQKSRLPIEWAQTCSLRMPAAAIDAMTSASAACSSVSWLASLATFRKERGESPHGQAKQIGLMFDSRRERLRNWASEWWAFLCPEVHPWMKRSASSAFRFHPSNCSVGRRWRPGPKERLERLTSSSREGSRSPAAWSAGVTVVASMVRACAPPPCLASSGESSPSEAGAPPPPTDMPPPDMPPPGAAASRSAAMLAGSKPETSSWTLRVPRPRRPRRPRATRRARTTMLALSS